LVSIALVGIHVRSGKAFGGLPSQLWLLAVGRIGLVAGTPLANLQPVALNLAVSALFSPISSPGDLFTRPLPREKDLYLVLAALILYLLVALNIVRASNASFSSRSPVLGVADCVVGILQFWRGTT